jgi:hemoglobin-like flavoprotein
MHSAYMIQMLDTALNMLGPDIELLSEIMHELGVKHVRYGVKPEMFPVMGEALFLTLENVLGSDFDTVTRAAWKETYNELSQDMVRAMAAPKRGSR